MLAFTAVGSRFAMLAVVILSLIIPLKAQGPIMYVPKEKWVNAETGNDFTNNGSFRFPWRTVTHALDEARCDPNIKWIRILYTDTPIAPASAAASVHAPSSCTPSFTCTASALAPDYGDPANGGNPALPGQEPCDAFPLDLPPGVELIGVPQPGTGRKPRLSINETVPGTTSIKTNYGWTSAFVPSGKRRPLIVAHDNCVVSNLELDGSTYMHKDLQQFQELVGIYVRNAINVQIRDCTIRDMFDGVVFTDENPGHPHTTTTATIQNCTISDCFPGSAPNPFPADTVANVAARHDRGHAAIRVEVLTLSATVAVTATNCTLERNHDGVETESGDGLSESLIDLTMDSCTIQEGETGIELISGDIGAPCNVQVNACRFLDIYNRKSCLGGYQSATAAGGFADTSAALSGRNKLSNVWVRNSTFRNCAKSLHAAGPAGVYDFGTPSDAGNNSFLLDSFAGSGALHIPAPLVPAPACSPDDQPLRVVMMHVRGTEVWACGNRWIDDNQGTTNAGNPDGCMVVGSCGGQAGTVCVATNAPPPLTAAGLSPSVLRNFTVEDVTFNAQTYPGKIHFGAACPPACPLPPLTPEPPFCLADAPSSTAVPFPDCPNCATCPAGCP
ncbi:MAG: hypothetical protein ACKVWV_04605 [Planctomycetota bacterium]